MNQCHCTHSHAHYMFSLRTCALSQNNPSNCSLPTSASAVRIQPTKRRLPLTSGFS